MKGQDDAPRWLPKAQHLRAVGAPFLPVNLPPNATGYPLRIHSEHLHLPQWTAANDGQFEPKGTA